jgi:hypothetical protein
LFRIGLSPLVADHVAEKSALFVLASLVVALQITIHNEEHHSEERIFLFQVVRTKKVAFPRQMDQERRCQGEISSVGPFVDEEIEVTVCVVLVLAEFYGQDAPVLVIVVVEKVVVFGVLELCQ